MDAAQLLASIVVSAIVTGAFGVLIKRTEGSASKVTSRTAAEAEAYTRAQTILNGIITAQERELSEKDAEIESLKLKLRKKKESG